MPAEEVAALIHPAGFYRNKALQIVEISKRLMAEYGGAVPDEIDELLKFKGVGRKTANLVVTLGFGKPGICVDTHVHRICNRWGYVSTRSPDETESALRKKASRPNTGWRSTICWWLSGKTMCHPLSPRCSACRLSGMCARDGVGRSR